MRIVSLALLLLSNTASSFGVQPFGRSDTAFVSSRRKASTLSEISADNLTLLSDRGRKALERLISHDVDGAQRHVYADWPEPGSQDADKHRLAEQVRTTNLVHFQLSRRTTRRTTTFSTHTQ